MSNKPPREELIELEPMDMHAPVEVKIGVHVKLPDGRSARLTFIMPAGQIPTRGEIAAAVHAVVAPADTVPAGTRLMTKPEFVEHITVRDTGAAIPLPGNQEFVASTIDIPHDMLVHAIKGVDMIGKDGDDFMMRGLAVPDMDDGFGHWSTFALLALPDEELLAIYQRVTA